MEGRPKILFVDDEPNFLAGIGRTLRKFRDEWDMEFALSVDEAMEILSQAKFDVIITDITMTPKSGFDLLRLIGADHHESSIPVVVLTGNAEVDLKSKALELGASDLLNKPVNSQDLVARIRSTLRLKAYQDEIKEQNRILEQRVLDRTASLEISRLEILWRLAKAGEFRDEETGNHTVRVGLYSRTIAEKLGLADDFVNNIFLTSPLHDIGKIGIPDGILLKKGKLTPIEWDIMRTHCVIGSSILSDEVTGVEYYLQMKSVEWPEIKQPVHRRNYLLEMASSIALSHHERWDGSGYPKGLAGEDIPIEARIVTIADVYDALKSERPYKPAFSDEKSYDIIKEEKGRQFDPDVVQVFIDNFEMFKAISSELRDPPALPAENTG